MQRQGAGIANIPIDREVKSKASTNAMIVLFVALMIGITIGTEIFAILMGFPEAKIFRSQLLGGPKIPYIYNPWALIWPWGQYIYVHIAPSVANRIYVALGISWATVMACIFTGMNLSKSSYKNTIMNAPRAHDYEGSSHWAGPVDIAKIGMDKGETILSPDHWAVKKAAKTYKKITNSKTATAKVLTMNEWKKRPGIFIGEYVDPKTGKVSWLRDISNRHVGLYAPTRGGKGVGVVIPAALSWSESMVVNDPKGELFEVTSWYRKNELGQNIFKFDPLSTDGSSVRINVLDFVRLRTEHEISDAQNIAKMLCDPQGLGLDTGSDSDHWRKTAYAFLTGIILHILYARDIDQDRKNLTGIDEFLSDPKCGIVKRCQDMMQYEHDPNVERGWTTIGGKLTKTNPTVAMAAKDMVDRPEGERGSVISSVKSYFDLYRNPIVAENVACSDMSFEDLMYNSKAATLYLINYPKDMEILRPLMRLIVNSIMTTFTGKGGFEKGIPKKKYKHELLMLMDEFTSTLNKMSIFANAISFVAGYGIKVVVVVQDLVQLADCYGDKGAQALTSNLHTQIMFATNNSDTAQQFSRMLGNQTIRQETRSWSGKGGPSRSESYRGRALLDASEVQALPSTDEIIMVTGEAPIHCNKIIYYKEPAFQNRYAGKEAVKMSDRLTREQQTFYHTFDEYIKEGEYAATKRIARYNASLSKVGPSAAVKAASKIFADMSTDGGETEEQSDDSDDLNYLRGIM